MSTLPTRNVDQPSHLASGTRDGRIVLWDITDQASPPQAQTIGGHEHGENGHTDTVRALVWAKNADGDTLLVSGSFDQHIIVWKLSASTGLLQFDKRLSDTSCADCAKAGTAHKAAVSTLQFIGSSGPMIASGSADGALKLWDLSTGAVLTTVAQFSSGVCSLAWLSKPARSVDGPTSWLAAGCGDHTIAICDPALGTQVATLRGHTGPVHALLWLEAQGWLVSGSADGTVRTWRVRADTA